jgi:hypothetical protein
MSTFLICTEVFNKRGGEHGRYFRFPLDAHNGDFDVKSRTAFNAFFNNPKKQRNWTPSREILYHVQDYSDYLLSQESWKKSPTRIKCKIEYEEPKLIELSSIFELFEAIGFNNKTKKYNT